MRRLVCAPRSIIGYHGCTKSVAERILGEGHFQSSQNTYDWLGRGAYFWEHAPYRALDWARFVGSLRGEEPAVLRATIRLGLCINLLDTKHMSGLASVYAELSKSLLTLPSNTLRGAHYLDRLIIDSYCEYYEERYRRKVHTVRGCFPEGAPIFNGSRILSRTHVQIAVRDARSILNVDMVTFPQDETMP